jgi:hypothetical protein
VQIGGFTPLSERVDETGTVERACRGEKSSRLQRDEGCTWSAGGENWKGSQGKQHGQSRSRAHLELAWVVCARTCVGCANILYHPLFITEGSCR